MTDPNTPTCKLLGRDLPVEIGSYVVERLIAGGPSYADYQASHRTLGHGLLLRHERWPSESRLPMAPVMDRATELDALEGLRRARALQAKLLHPRILPLIDFFDYENEWFSVFAQLEEA